MARKNTPTNINSYKQRWNFNIGIILFGVIFIYLVATIIIYITNHNISVYEVRRGSLIRDTAFTGFVIREELPISAEEAGYLNYYVSDREKVSFGAKVYALSAEELLFAEEEVETLPSLTAEEQQNLRRKTQTFVEQFRGNHFESAYVFKGEISSALDNGKRDSRIAQLDVLLENSENITISHAPQEGIVVYSVDGYEEVQVKDVNASHIWREDYNPMQIRNNTQINKGDIAYKLITDENWGVVIALEEEDVEELSELTSVNVRFAKDDQTMWADFSIMDKGEDGVYGYLQFNKSMIRYAADRYLNIELILENQSGLKIPKSAVTTKEFFVVPEAFLTIGGNSQESGFMYKNENEEFVFKRADVYYKDEENGMLYLDTLNLTEGTILLKPGSANETMYLQEKGTLQGVYNINKGYAVFKQIHILSESEEYYIVIEGNRYSLSNYDHISLIGDSIQENDIVF